MPELLKSPSQAYASSCPN